jgi:hypothetical protein
MPAYVLASCSSTSNIAEISSYPEHHLFTRILLIIGVVLILLGGAGLLYSLTRQSPRKTDSFDVTDQLPQVKGLLRAFPSSPTRAANLDGNAELQRKRPESIQTPLNTQPRASAFLHHSSQSRSIFVPEAKPPLPPRISIDATTSSQPAEAVVQTPSPTPTPAAELKHRNSLRRFFQWFFRLFHKKKPTPENQPPTVSLSSSTSLMTLPCPEGIGSESCAASETGSAQLDANAIDPDNDKLLYTWSVSGGRLFGEGARVNWDLSAVNPGTYTATVNVSDANGSSIQRSTTVTIAECRQCSPYRPYPPYPTPGPPPRPRPTPQGTPFPSPQGAPLPSPQGTPLPSPQETPLPSPQETPAPTPLGTRVRKPINIGVTNANSNTSNSPSPSPTQTSTPSTSPSPSTTTKEVDRVELNYPIKLPVGWSENVTVHFVRTSEKAFIPVIENGGRRIVTATPNPIPGATPGTYKQAWGSDYATFATVELKAINLETQPLSQARQSLDPPNVEWGWHISGKKDFLGKQTLRISINVEGQKRDNPSVKIILDNPTVIVRDFSIEVADSWFTRAQVTVGSVVSTFAGAGVTVPWIYDRIKGRSKPKTKKKRKKK